MSDALLHKLTILAASAGGQSPGATVGDEIELAGAIIWLIALGSVVLLVWGFATALHPERATLRRCPRRPTTLNPVHIIVVFFLWHGLTIGVMEALQAWGVARFQAGVLGSLAGQMVGIPLALFVAWTCFRRGLRWGLGLSARHWLFDTGRGIAGYLAVFPVCLGLVQLFAWLLPADWQSKHSMLVALDELTPAYKTLVIISAVVLAPVLEELFFRGLLQSMLRRYVKPWPGILIASAIFACVHAQAQNIPALFVLGIALGYNYERCGRLWPVVLIHMLFNGVVLTFYLTR